MIRLLLSILAFAAITPVNAEKPKPVTVRMSIDEEPFVPLLAQSLGFLGDEGIVIERVKIEDFAPNDYEMQKPMREGKIDAAYHWYNHAVFGARHGLPVVAVMNFNDAPGMSVFVQTSQVGAIKSAADFRGKTIAAGAGYGTKALVTHALAARFGLRAGDYSLVFKESAGRQERILAALADASVSAVASEEPLTSIVQETGKVAKLYDLTSRAATIRTFGASWPAQSLLMSPGFIKQNPETAQRLVNAFVRTMRWVNAHSAEEIAAQLPESYFAAKGRTAQIAYIQATLPSYTKEDYSISNSGAKLVAKSIDAYRFDDSPSGQWRATRTKDGFRVDSTFDNRFVKRAMRQF